jgi:hypothetical protein
MALNISPQQERAIIFAYRQVIGRRGGLAKGGRKAVTSARNGRLGGRPRKNRLAAALA